MSEDINKRLEDLEKALEAGRNNLDLSNSPALNVERLEELSRKYLTAGARYDLSRKAFTLIKLDENDRVFKCIYFAVRVRTQNVEKGAAAIAGVINDLSQQGLIHSCLAPISSLQLARLNMQAPQSVVFCFVLIPAEAHAAAKERYHTIHIEEGGVGEAIDDLTIDSEDGEFFASIRIHSQCLMIQGNDVKSTLQESIDRYLAVLPKGTVVREVNELTVTDLSVPFEVKFYNPLLKNVKSVDIQTTRCAEMVNDKLEQFNLFKGIHYFDKNNNQLYK